MRVVHYELGRDPYDMTTGVEVCHTEEEYLAAIAMVLRYDDVRSVNVYYVQEAVELTRLEIRKSLRAAAGLIDGFGEEGAILKKAMVDKALWSIRRLALQRIKELQSKEKIKGLADKLVARKGKPKKKK